MLKHLLQPLRTGIQRLRTIGKLEISLLANTLRSDQCLPGSPSVIRVCARTSIASIYIVWTLVDKIIKLSESLPTFNICNIKIPHPQQCIKYIIYINLVQSHRINIILFLVGQSNSINTAVCVSIFLSFIYHFIETIQERLILEITW